MLTKNISTDFGNRKLPPTNGLAIPRADGTCALGGSAWLSSSPGRPSSNRLLVMWLGIYTFMGRRIGRAGRAMNAAASPSPLRYKALLSGKGADTAQEYFAANEPRIYSMLRTSISPNIFKGGYRSNVIPSEAEATLDIRALPDEDMGRLLDEMARVINDSQVKIIPNFGGRPSPRPSKLDTEAFRVAENAAKKIYNTLTIPTLLTGATDMSYLRAKGVECYGIGPMTDTEDGPKGFGAHSDQERILEESLHKFVQFNWEIIFNLAKGN
jgi:acetylornithine deacetylase/succinyl-diaminopimelate desuccinylase-like protein